MTMATDRGTTINLEELRGQLAGRVALLPVIGAIILGIERSSRREAISYEAIAMLSGFLALGLGVMLLMRSHQRIARHWIAWGLNAALLAAMWSDAAPWLPFAGLVLVFVNAMIVSGGELVTAGLIGVEAAWLVEQQARPYPLPRADVGVGACGCVGLADRADALHGARVGLDHAAASR